MKKLFIIVLLMLMSNYLSINVYATEESDLRYENAIKTIEEYKHKCYQESYEKMDKKLLESPVFPGYKYAEKDYAKCIENIIFERLENGFPKDAALSKETIAEMKDMLADASRGIRAFYWRIYNSQDNGVLGEAQNDAKYSHFLDTVLEDIIKYQALQSSSF